ncbi:hypothetical protein DRN82_07495 [Thermococci archaeon]|nr:MAG: hypothetical protein DRN82_07495 [Thermococci archaeon]
MLLLTPRGTWRNLINHGFSLNLLIIFGQILLFTTTEGLINFLLFVVYFFGVAEVFSKIMRKLGKGEVLTGELGEGVRAICTGHGIKIRNVYLINVNCIEPNPVFSPVEGTFT